MAKDGGNTMPHACAWELLKEIKEEIASPLFLPLRREETASAAMKWTKTNESKTKLTLAHPQMWSAENKQKNEKNLRNISFSLLDDGGSRSQCSRAHLGLHQVERGYNR